MCGRHEAANEAASECLTAWPASQAYLRSEALWRQGDIPAAIAVLASYSQTSPTKPSGVGTGTSHRAPIESTSMHQQEGGQKHSKDDDHLQQQHTQNSEQHLASLSGAFVPSDDRNSNHQASTSSSTSTRHERFQQEKPIPQQQQDPAHHSLCHLSDTTADGCEPKQQSSADISRIQELCRLPALSSSSNSAPSNSRLLGNATNCLAEASNLCQPGAEHEDAGGPGQAAADVQQVMGEPPRCQSLLEFLKPLHALQKAASDAHEDGEPKQLPHIG